jgi:hypothetical protein
MNQLADTKSVLGDFSGKPVTLSDGTITFAQENGVYRMTVHRAGQLVRRYRVTRTVGWITMQFYVGVQEEGPEPPDHPVYREHMLPFAYWYRVGRWLPKCYFDPDGPDKEENGTLHVDGVHDVRDLRPYNAICMNCHNTFPYAYRIYHENLCGFPGTTVAAAIEPLSKALAPTVPVEPTVAGFKQLNGRLDPDKHLVTLGISCESCHFGGREHAQNEERIHFLPTSSMVQLRPQQGHKPLTDSRKDPATITGICTQCHSGLCQKFPNGAGHINSSEGIDMSGGACTSQISCISCHDPHRRGVLSGGSTDPQHLAACVKCHSQFKEQAPALAHGRHSEASGVNCMDCHMPRYTQGVTELIRTHRISQPVEESMVAKGSANACNLCHLDKSIRWTLQELERGWGRRIEAKDSWAGAYNGSLDNPVGEVWLKGEHTGLRLVAAGSYSRSPLGKAKLPDIVHALNDPEPINRVFATFAVERLMDGRLDPAVIDITAPSATRARQIDVFLADWSRTKH